MGLAEIDMLRTEPEPRTTTAPIDPKDPVMVRNIRNYIDIPERKENNT